MLNDDYESPPSDVDLKMALLHSVPGFLLCDDFKSGLMRHVVQNFLGTIIDTTGYAL